MNLFSNVQHEIFLYYIPDNIRIKEFLNGCAAHAKYIGSLAIHINVTFFLRGRISVSRS